MSGDTWRCDGCGAEMRRTKDETVHVREYELRHALASRNVRIEELEEKLREMTARALGHAYATSMAEGGESIQHQELQYERRQHGETQATLRKYECALTSIANNDMCHGGCGKDARAALRETPSGGDPR